MVELGNLLPLGRDQSLQIGPGSPTRQALDEFVDGDPLGMVERARRELSKRFFLWDAEALGIRALAILAHRQLAEKRSRCTETLLAAALTEALEGLVLGGPVSATACAREATSFEALGLPIGLSGEAVARACRVHNRASLEERRAFRGLVIDECSLDEVAHEMGCGGGRVARAARRLLLKFYQESVTSATASNDFGTRPRSEHLSQGTAQ